MRRKLKMFLVIFILFFCMFFKCTETQAVTVTVSSSSKLKSEQYTNEDIELGNMIAFFADNGWVNGNINGSPTYGGEYTHAFFNVYYGCFFGKEFDNKITRIQSGYDRYYVQRDIPVDRFDQNKYMTTKTTQLYAISRSNNNYTSNVKQGNMDNYKTAAQYAFRYFDDKNIALPVNVWGNDDSLVSKSENFETYYKNFVNKVYNNNPPDWYNNLNKKIIKNNDSSESWNKLMNLKSDTEERISGKIEDRLTQDFAGVQNTTTPTKVTSGTHKDEYKYLIGPVTEPSYFYNDNTFSKLIYKRIYFTTNNVNKDEDYENISYETISGKKYIVIYRNSEDIKKIKRVQYKYRWNGLRQGFAYKYPIYKSEDNTKTDFYNIMATQFEYETIFKVNFKGLTVEEGGVDVSLNHYILKTQSTDNTTNNPPIARAKNEDDEDDIYYYRNGPLDRSSLDTAKVKKTQAAIIDNGDTLTFRTVLTNNSDSQVRVKIKDTLPDNVELVAVKGRKFNPI